MKFLREHWKWFIGLLALGGIIWAAKTLPLQEWVENAATPLRQLGFAGVALFALSYFLAAMLCIPCMPLTLAAGFIFGTGEGVLAVHTGSTLASACGFLVGRYAGRARTARFLRNSKRLHFLEDAIANDGWKIVGLLRMHPLPFGASNYLYGMTSIEFWPYMLATFTAMLPGHFIYVYIGEVGRRHLSGQDEVGIVHWIAPALGILSTIILTAVITHTVRKHGGLKNLYAAR